MLRITQLRCTPTLVTLKVEGRVAADWVPVLERECVQHIDGGRVVRLDFSAVSLIDREGLAMLRKLATSHVEIVNASPFIQALLAGESPR
jgi:ABC-type transporter Mla MlaB component